ncbi:MAG: chemotaxis-specific protein-glutamate methyltransferase CheB [Lachnospiraceae bacterium]|nr:chemotaxis-specific protein-glutamate methyltransferase CheB [Lachnospiraceae bacterium]
MKKNILVVDDSALMRRILCDIINSDERFQVTDKAVNGLDALELISTKQYDAVVLDINMPKMTGLQLLKELQVRKISANVIMASTDTIDGAQVVMDALELGALDFIHKPYNTVELRKESFQKKLLNILDAATQSQIKSLTLSKPVKIERASPKIMEFVEKHVADFKGKKVVAIASSTGGPKALQQVIPVLPENLKVPVMIVQHMPAGFTKSFAERLNTLSKVSVKEAEEGDVLEAGKVYLARGGSHMNAVEKSGKVYIHYTDEPSREGVKPCANYMFESLKKCSYDEVVCVVLTGMGADGTKGIVHLKETKKIHVIAQEKSTCAVYGMPRSIVDSGLANQVVRIEQVAQEIILNVGVK